MLRLQHLQRKPLKYSLNRYLNRNFSNDLQVPTHARVVIIGGGIIGNSVAYHLGMLALIHQLMLTNDSFTYLLTYIYIRSLGYEGCYIIRSIQINIR